MSDTCMDRRWCRGVLLRILICWTFIGLCSAGHRPFSKLEWPRRTGHHDRLPQRTDSQAAQQIRYPFLNNQGQIVEYPSFPDASFQVQVKTYAAFCYERIFFRSLQPPLTLSFILKVLVIK